MLVASIVGGGGKQAEPRGNTLPSSGCWQAFQTYHQRRSHHYLDYHIGECEEYLILAEMHGEIMHCTTVWPEPYKAAAHCATSTFNTWGTHVNHCLCHDVFYPHVFYLNWHMCSMVEGTCMLISYTILTWGSCIKQLVINSCGCVCRLQTAKEAQSNKAEEVGRLENENLNLRQNLDDFKETHKLVHHLST